MVAKKEKERGDKVHESFGETTCQQFLCTAYKMILSLQYAGELTTETFVILFMYSIWSGFNEQSSTRGY